MSPGAAMLRGMRAALRRLHSLDADPLAEFAPDDPESFSIFVQALVGPQDAEGEESFDFTITTASWLAEHSAPEKGFEFLQGVLLLSRWDYDIVVRAIGDLCRRTEGETWEEVAMSLSRYGHWEFADYRE
jgi:immunity protein 8 of polymorphic toxin system